MRIGFKPQCELELPVWTRTLSNYYWHIRVEGRDKVKRRRLYRCIAKEKLRLVEFGLEQELVESACRDLSGFNRKAGSRLLLSLTQASPQLKLDLCS